MERLLDIVFRRRSADQEWSQPVRSPRVDVFEWRPRNGAVNFGDHLATVVTSRLLAGVGKLPGDEVTKPARLLTVGSVLHFARNGDTVWGSGINGKIADEHHRFSHLDVRAVRGPRTAEVLARRGIRVPEIYGDPALLIPALFPGRFQRQIRYRVLFIPNLNDQRLSDNAVRTISPLRGWNRIIEEIVAAELVVASSLHGIILAEAFRVPARYVRLNEAESLFKYEDYGLGTGRASLEFARSIPEAIEMGGMAPAVFNPAPLLHAFPYELWD